MQGTSLTKQERECKLYDEFDKFAYKKEETLRDFYLIFSLLLNDMNIYNVKLEQFQVNTKFLNTLPPEWSKFVTDVKLVRDFIPPPLILHFMLHWYNNEFHANEVRLMHERNSDPLALNFMNSLDPSPSCRPTIVEVLKELPKVRCALNFDQYFELNELKAQSQEKDTVIRKLKERIKSLSGNINEDKVKKDIKEIETINIKLDHKVSKLIAENESLKQTYKQLYDSIKPTRIRSKEQCDALINQVNQKSVEISDLNVSLQEKDLVITALKDELRKLKGKDLADNVVTKHIIAPEMLKVDMEPIAPKLLNNRTTHYDYLRHTQEQAVILREVVKQGKSQNPLNNSLDSACKDGFVDQDNPNHVYKLKKALYGLKQSPHAWYDLLLKFLLSREFSKGTADPTLFIKRQGKDILLISQSPRDIFLNQSKYALKSLKKYGTESSDPVDSPMVEKSKLDKDIQGKAIDPHTIMEWWEPLCISQPGTVNRGLWYPKDSSIALTAYANADHAKGLLRNNLYTLSLGDMMASSPICLLSKASKTKSWLWHRHLSHLNFSTINHLARHGLVRCLPKLKFEKDHLCSACAMGKSKKKPHKPKFEDTNQEKLYLLHKDLCGPMRVASVNGKK
ncbi:retrovirus-related pol polyprotein from transposon TNT 1-94 [Tanacetum coccineum]